jgi:maltose O-acetyltransferase
VGENASFTSAERRIVIGDNVMFGPSVAIIGGNHRFKDIVGKYMIEAKDINPQDHGDVIIEEDCWIGFGTIILKGVKIGKGSVIGAGSIVTRDIPQYSIYVGAPLLSLRRRWDLKTIELHERLISKRAC